MSRRALSDETAAECARRYFEAWTDGDRAAARSLLADALDFRSPQDRFASADAFLDACWQYSEGLVAVAILKEVTDGAQVVLCLDWKLQDGAHFVSAEYVRVAEGRITEIVVLNNAPECARLFA
jgi:ketosteroid isomerase-like protein